MIRHHFYLCLIAAVVSSTSSPTAAQNTHWSGFRGAGDSHVRVDSVPVSWETRGRRDGQWTVRLPGYGQSSPVIWNDKVFVTAVSGEQKEHLHVLAINLADGQTLWRKDFAGTQRVPDGDTVSRGAPTPVLDADRCYALFESGDLFVLTHAGETVWQRSIVKEYGEFKGPHGYGSSPVLVGSALVLQVCHGGPSYVLALDKATGQTLWKAEHPSQTGWSTPAVFQRGDLTGVIVSSSGSVRAYDARDGRELWFVTGVQGNSTPSPTIAGDCVVIGGSTERMGRSPPSETSVGSLAIRLGGAGDVSRSHVLWRSPKVAAGYASPLVHDGLAHFVSRVGVAMCVDAATGDVKWQHRLPGTAWASPLAHKGKLFFFCKEGAVVVLKAGPDLEEIDESTISSTDVIYGVAATEGAWIVRSGRGLFRIGTAAETAPAASAR